MLYSVQSQAGRVGLALQEAIDAGAIRIPLVVVDFTKYEPRGDLKTDERQCCLHDRVGKITNMRVPQRFADATLRYRQLNGLPFRKSEPGKALYRASAPNATPLFEVGPTALLFVISDSTSPKGGLGAKFQRAVVSEIAGVAALSEDDYLNRCVPRHPFEISKNVRALPSDKRTTFTVAKNNENGGIKPSALGLSSVPFDVQNCAVTVKCAEQTSIISLRCLRRLRFPLNGRLPRDDMDVEAPKVLAALGLCAAALAFEGVATWALATYFVLKGRWYGNCSLNLGRTERFPLTAEDAISLLDSAVEEQEGAGLSWPEDQLVLEPCTDLVKLV